MMQCIRGVVTELISLNRLSSLSIITNAVDASFSVATIVLLGHLGKGHLSAGVVALAFYNISWYFVEGMLTAQDNLVSRSFALKDRKSARYWSYIAFGVTILVCIPTSLLFILAAIIIQFAFQIRQHTAQKAAEFLILLLPGFWCHAMYRVFQKYMLCQRQIKLPLICSLLGLSSNILASYLLTYVLGLGYSGCAWGNIIGRGTMLIFSISYVCKIEDINIAMEELTYIAKSIRKQYFTQPFTALRDHEQEQEEAREREQVRLKGKHSKKKRGVGKGNRIAPISSESQHGDVENALHTNSQREIEMTTISQYNDTTSSNSGKIIKKGGSAADVEETAVAVAKHTDRSKDSHSKDEERKSEYKEENNITETETFPLEEGSTDAAKESVMEDAEQEATVGLITGQSPSSSALEPIKVSQRTGKAVVADVLRFLFLGLPGGVMLGAEFGLFEVLTITVAHMGSVVIDTNQILLTIANFFFLSLPFAISVASTVQISKHLARKRYRRAKTTAILCVLEGSALMLTAAGIVYVLRDHIGYAFTSNSDIINRLKPMAPYLAGFQAAYGVYGSAQGVLRATSHQLDILGWTVLAVWLVGLPIGLYLAFVTRPTYGLQGLWIGLIVGMALLAFALVLQVCLLDWKKEARKAEFRLRLQGRHPDREDPTSEGRLQLEEGGSAGIVMNPLSVSQQHTAYIQGNSALPSIGSRAVGGFPVEHLFLRTAEEELAELEYMEYGDIAGTGAGVRAPGGRGGGKKVVTKALSEVVEEQEDEDDVDYKRISSNGCDQEQEMISSVPTVWNNHVNK